MSAASAVGTWARLLQWGGRAVRRTHVPHTFHARVCPAAPDRCRCPARRTGRRPARPGRAHRAQVFLRRAGLAPVRRHHRTERVLPHAHRGRHLQRPGRGHGAAGAARCGADRPGRRQLRQGGGPVPRAATGRLRGGGHFGGLPAGRPGPAAAAPPAAAHAGPGAGLFQRAGAARAGRRLAGRARPGRGAALRVLPRVEHRQLHARRGPGPAAPGAGGVRARGPAAACSSAWTA